MSNPWHSLPQSPPYIAEDDRQLLRGISAELGLRFDVLPEAFIGNIQTAKVVFLLLNPAFKETDFTENMKNADFVEQNRKSLLHASEYPFYCLEDKFSDSSGHQWWNKRLRTLFEYFGSSGKNHVRSKIMCIQYFPYHSENFRSLGCTLPSQEYSFSLVRKAISDRKLIIVMRSKKLWLKSVPELKDYPYILLKNPRSPYVTRNNMTEEEFQKLIHALRD